MTSSINTGNGKRKQFPRTVFTPTQRASATIAKYYLLFFNATESYQVVARSSIKTIDDEGFAIIAIRNKLLKGKVIFKGSMDDCEMELTLRTRLSQQENNINKMDLDQDEGDNEVENEDEAENEDKDEDEDEDEDEGGAEDGAEGDNEGDDQADNVSMMAATQRRITTQSHFGTASSITFDGPLSPVNDEVANENSISNKNVLNHHRNSTKNRPTNKRKRTSNNKSKKRKRVDNRADSYLATGRTDTNSEITISGASILNALENKFTVLENQLMSIENKNSQKMVTLNKKLDHLTASSIINKTLLDAYRDEHNEIFETELIYNTINLLDTVASSVGDFARKTMRIVFSEHELKTHVLPPTRSYLARTSLDEKKFQLVNNAVRIKFKIDSTKYPAFYKNILRRKLSDFLIEERRRESTRMAHHAKQQMNLTQIK